MRKKTSNQVQIASFSDSSCIKRRSKICKSGTEEYSFPHRAQSEERNTGGGGGPQQQQQESRLQDFGYGGRAESETEKARNEEPDGARKTTRWRREIQFSSPPYSTITSLLVHFWREFTPKTSPPPSHRRRETPISSVRYHKTPSIRLPTWWALNPPPTPAFPIPTFPKQGFFLISFF
jgi:hypothetical protein